MTQATTELTAEEIGQIKGQFVNRIVGYGTKPASQFTAHPLNARRHPQNQREAVNASLAELGWIQDVIENQRTGYLIDGHERVWQALAADDQDVPYKIIDLPEELEPLALAIYDRTGELAVWDAGAFQLLYASIETDVPILRALMDQHAAELHINNAPEAPESFNEYDENIPTEHRCPQCGYVWSGKAA